MSINRSNTAVRDLQALFDVEVTGTLTDGQLLDRFVARREGAVFEAIIHRHGPMVWGVCRRVLRDHHDAEDAFQATFLVLARKASTVLPREKLGNWLYGVASQTAIRARTSRSRRRMREGQVTDMPEPEAVSQDHREDLTEWLDRELSRLPEKYRIPIVLCELEGKTHREATEQLGWPIGTVSGRLSRARAMLARRLSRRGMSLSAGSLAVLLAQESASASLPTKLIGSTAQAAGLLAAGGVASAGAVPAGFATLTGGVMKIMMLKRLHAIGSLTIGALILVAGVGLAVSRDPEPPKAPPVSPVGIALAVSRDPEPAKAPPASAVGGESTSFRQVEVGVDELIHHTGLNIYKFQADIPKGKRFRVIWREVNVSSKGNRDHFVYAFQKKTDEPATILVSFLSRGKRFEGVLLGDEKEAQFRLSCGGCSPGEIVTIVPLPLAGREPTQKSLIVHRSEKPNDQLLRWQ